MEKISYKDCFLPEVGITIYNSELDVEELDAETIISYHQLVIDRLARLDTYYAEHYEEACKLVYNEKELNISFDVYDFLPGALKQLQEYYPDMTEIKIISMLVEDEYVNHLSVL